jgi:hypothetical protein
MGGFGSSDIACAVRRRRRVADAEIHPAGQLFGILIRHTPCFEALSIAVGAHVIAMILASGVAVLVTRVACAAPLGSARLPAVHTSVIARAANDERDPAPPAAFFSTVDHHTAPGRAENLVAGNGACETAGSTASPEGSGSTPGLSLSAGRPISYAAGLARADFLDAGSEPGRSARSERGAPCETGEGRLFQR